MEKFLLVIDAADDAAMFPVSGIRAITCAGDGAVLLQFAPGIHDPTGDDADADIITLTITADTEVAVLKVLVEKLLGTQNGPGGQAGVLMVCDDVNSVFAHPNILSCTITKNAI